MILKYWRLIFFALVIVVFVFGIFWIINKFALKEKFSGEEFRNYQILVTVYDDKNTDPVEDRKSSMKKGYVIGVSPEDHQWSETERIGYLILRMKLTEKEANKITESIMKYADIENLPLVEKQKIIDEKKDAEMEKEIYSAREYKIDLEKIGFSDPNSLLNGQPYLDKVFDWSIVTKT